MFRRYLLTFFSVFTLASSFISTSAYSQVPWPESNQEKVQVIEDMNLVLAFTNGYPQYWSRNYSDKEFIKIWKRFISILQSWGDDGAEVLKYIDEKNIEMDAMRVFFKAERLIRQFQHHLAGLRSQDTISKDVFLALFRPNVSKRTNLFWLDRDVWPLLDFVAITDIPEVIEELESIKVKLTGDPEDQEFINRLNSRLRARL